MERVIYDLPDDWSWVPLGTVATLFNGRAYKKAELLDTGPTPVLRVGNFFSNRSWYYSDLDLPDEKYCDEGDLLYAWSASFGPKIWEGPRAIYHYHIWKILTSEHIDKKFLFYLLEKDSEDIKAQGNGVGMFHATKGGMEKMLVPLPPISEQKRIVKKLDALLTRIDTAIEHLQESFTLADALFKSTLSSLVCDESKEYEKLSLEELGSFSGGGTPSKSKSEFWNGRILWVTPKDMKSPVVTDSELKITKEGVLGSSAKFIPPRSILIVARSGILRRTLPVCINETECTVNQDIKVFIPSERITSEYTQHMLKGYESFILSELVKGGVTVESLKYKDFQNFKFPVPSVEQQNKIVDELSKISQLTDPVKSELVDKIEQLKQLKVSIVNSAFKGEL